MNLRDILRGRWWIILIALLFLAFIAETAHFGWKVINIEGPPTAALSLDLSGAGTVSPKKGTHQLVKGEMVIVEALPGEGWVFSHWEGPVADERVPRTTVTLDHDTAVRAVFVEEDLGLYAYTIKVKGEGEVSPGAGRYEFLPDDEGILIPVQAKPSPGHLFDRWTLNGAEVGRDQFYRLSLADGVELTAHFDPLYAVTVDATKGGSVHGPADLLEKGDRVKVEAISERGYAFIQWTEEGEAVSDSPTYIFEVKGDRHLTAQFLPLYKVAVFSTRGGKAASSHELATAGAAVRVTAKPDPGYAFIRWVEGGRRVAEGIDLGFIFIPLSFINTPDYSFTLERDRHLVAEFARVYPIDVKVVGKGSVKTPGDRAVMGKKSTIFAIPDEGHLFDRWTEGDKEYSGEVFKFWGDRHLKLTAHFVRAVQIDTGVDPETGGAVKGGGTYKEGSEVVLKASPAANYEFAGWYEGGAKVGDDQNYTLKADEDRRLTARFEPYIEVTTQARPEEGGRVWGAGFYKKGEEVVLRAATAQGYRFSGWLKDNIAAGDDSVRYAFTAEESCTVEALFEEVGTHTVDLIIEPSVDAGHVSGGGSYNKGTSVTVFAVPKVNYRFRNWTEDGVEVGKKMHYSFTLDRDRTLKANFSKIYYLGLSAEPEEGGQVVGRGYHEAGAAVPVQAIPSYGYRFDNWIEGERELDEPEEFNYELVDNTALVARFIKAHLVNIAYDEFEGGTFTGEGTHDVGGEVTVVATPFDGYVFVKWLRDGVKVSEEEEYTFTMPDEPVSLVAVFLPLYDIEVTATPAGSGTVTGAGIYVRGDPVTVKAVAGEGYDFYRWEENGEAVSYTANYTFNAAKSCTLTAVFRPLRTITLEGQPASWGQVTADWKYPDTKQHPEGADLKITATPGAGYTFKEWTSGGVLFTKDRIHTFTVGSSDLHLVAHFDEWPSHEISVESANPGWGSVSGGEIYDEGSPATVVATPNDGYYFSHWSEGGQTVSGAGATYTFTVTGPRHLVAHFVGPVTVRAYTTGGGNVSIQHPGGTTSQTTDISVAVAPGSNVTVRSHASSNYNFDGWYEGSSRVSTSANYAVNNVTANRTFEARFNEQSGCPYIYSFDGEDYHFEHSAVDWSLFKAIEDTTHGPLHRLKETGGQYRIMVTEKLPEKSFVNGVELSVIDYPKDNGVIGVMPDFDGNLHTIKERIEPVSFTDNRGNDLLEAVNTEGVLIETDGVARYEEEEYLDCYEALFDVPEDANTAKLLIKVRGSSLRDVAAYWVMDTVDAHDNMWWLEEVVGAVPWLKQQVLTLMDASNLKVDLWDGAQWIPQDELRAVWPPPAGTRQMHEVLVPLDLPAQNVPLKIRLTSPSGFFIIDRIAVDFSDDLPLKVDTISPREALFNDSDDVLEAISDPHDDLRVRMVQGERVDLVFDAPESLADHERAFVFAVRGYFHYDGDSVEGSLHWNAERGALNNVKELISSLGKAVPKAVKIIPALLKMVGGSDDELEDVVEETMVDNVIPWAREKGLLP